MKQPIVDARLRAADRLALEAIRLHDAAAVEHLGQRGRQFASLDHALGGRFFHRAAEIAGDPGDDGKHHNGKQR